MLFSTSAREGDVVTSLSEAVYWGMVFPLYAVAAICVSPLCVLTVIVPSGSRSASEFGGENFGVWSIVRKTM